jgi:hypothetical protein
MARYCDHPEPSYYYLTKGYQAWPGVSAEEGGPEMQVLGYATDAQERCSAAIMPDGKLSLASTDESLRWQGELTGRPIRCQFLNDGRLEVHREDGQVCYLTPQAPPWRCPMYIRRIERLLQPGRGVVGQMLSDMLAFR